MQLNNVPALGLISVYINGALVSRSSYKDAQRCFNKLAFRMCSLGKPCLLELTTAPSKGRRVLDICTIH